MRVAAVVVVIIFVRYHLYNATHAACIRVHGRKKGENEKDNEKTEREMSVVRPE